QQILRLRPTPLGGGRRCLTGDLRERLAQCPFGGRAGLLLTLAKRFQRLLLTLGQRLEALLGLRELGAQRLELAGHPPHVALVDQIVVQPAGAGQRPERDQERETREQPSAARLSRLGRHPRRLGRYRRSRRRTRRFHTGTGGWLASLTQRIR